jgi:hypothetical protein
MTGKMIARRGAALGALLALAALAGCSSPGGGAAMSKQEQDNFKGGPVPPEAQKAMLEATQKASQNKPTSGQ